MRPIIYLNYVVSRAMQENLSRPNVSFMLCTLQLLDWCRAFCRVSRKYNFGMKKPSRRTILVCAIALHGESFRWAAVYTEYKPLMQSTRHTLDLSLTCTL